MHMTLHSAPADKHLKAHKLGARLAPQPHGRALPHNTALKPGVKPYKNPGGCTRLYL